MKWEDYYYSSKLVCDWYYHTTNFGDYLNKWLITKISGKELIHVDADYDFSNSEVYACIGSILQKKFKYPTNVWGAGAMYPDRKCYNIKKVYAVRGEFTREVLINNGIECPEVYGDPAILLPMFYQPESYEKQYVMGILPHYVDNKEEIVQKYKISHGVNFINILDPIEKVIDEIVKCDYVISSSLHGLVAADAYNIPSLWVEFSNNVRGEGFKFADYYTGLGINPFLPVDLKDNFLPISEIERKISRISKIDTSIQNKLLDVCPFKKEV
jgi:pyruvyltransferase